MRLCARLTTCREEAGPSEPETVMGGTSKGAWSRGGGARSRKPGYWYNRQSRRYDVREA